MRRSATGWWIEEAGGGGAARPPLAGDVVADPAVIGGGYLGLWTAWQLAAAAPGARIVVLEAERCGFGPSGRNGGFVSPLWDRADDMVARWGADAARAIGAASDTAVDGIGAWCAEQGVDAWFRPAEQLEVATTERHRGGGAGATAACAALGFGDRRRALTADEVRARCASPRFLDGTASTREATVQPARLAFGLRDAVAALPGVTVHEHSRVRALDDGPDGVRVRTDGGTVRARSAALCVNTGIGAVRPLANRFAVASSHLVVTEPVPDVLDALGWTGGESITDGPTLIHYTRTTPDGRIAFGWAGGRMGYGARRSPALDLDPAVQDRVVRELAWTFPALGERPPVAAAWGGPIDVSPLHLPLFGSLGSVHWGAGFTGNGVGPSHLGGRILADLCRDARTDLTRLALVDTAPRSFPPEPLRWAGGAVTRAALLRVDAAEAAGRRPDPVSRVLAAVPGKLGFHLPR
jgi:glycine/D-amino acid oxidase-like deaminating enzyme